jgi:hypothetical protein
VTVYGGLDDISILIEADELAGGAVLPGFSVARA